MIPHIGDGSHGDDRVCVGLACGWCRSAPARRMVLPAEIESAVVRQPKVAAAATTDTPPEEIAPVLFAPAAGEYNAAVMVVLSCETAQADIYYTIDGAVPTKNSRKYSLRGPFLVQKTTTVRARYVPASPRSRPRGAQLTDRVGHAGAMERTQRHLPAQGDGPDHGGDVHHQRALNRSFVLFSQATWRVCRKVSKGSSICTSYVTPQATTRTQSRATWYSRATPVSRGCRRLRKLRRATTNTNSSSFSELFCINKQSFFSWGEGAVFVSNAA